MLDHELVGRADHQQHEGAAIEAISEALAPGQRLIFRDRQRFHVADAATIEIAGTAVVDVVRLAPIAVREQRDQPEHAADDVVRTFGLEERAMAAIVLHDEHAHVQARSRQGQQQHPTIVPVMGDAIGHQRPQRDEQRHGIDQLPKRTTEVRLRIDGTELAQLRGTGRKRGRMGQGNSPVKAGIVGAWAAARKFNRSLQ